MIPYLSLLFVAGLLTVVPAQGTGQEKAVLQLSSPQSEGAHSFSVRRGVRVHWEVARGSLHLSIRQADRRTTLIQAAVYGPGQGTSSLGNPGSYVLHVQGDGDWTVTVWELPSRAGQ